MAETIIKAQIRDEFGKGAARRLRRNKLIPAVMYSHGSEPIHLSLPAHATTLAVRNANALLSIELADAKTQLALPKQIQRDPVTGTVKHVDLIIIKRGDKVQVEVPLIVTGEVRGSAIVNLDQNTILLEVEATNIPASIEISVDDQDVGYIINAADVVLPEGATLVGEPDVLILSVQAPKAEVVDETADEEAADETVEESQE